MMPAMPPCMPLGAAPAPSSVEGVEGGWLMSTKGSTASIWESEEERRRRRNKKQETRNKKKQKMKEIKDQNKRKQNNTQKTPRNRQEQKSTTTPTITAPTQHVVLLTGRRRSGIRGVQCFHRHDIQSTIRRHHSSNKTSVGAKFGFRVLKTSRGGRKKKPSEQPYPNHRIQRPTRVPYL